MSSVRSTTAHIIGRYFLTVASWSATGIWHWLFKALFSFRC